MQVEQLEQRRLALTASSATTLAEEQQQQQQHPHQHQQRHSGALPVGAELRAAASNSGSGITDALLEANGRLSQMLDDMPADLSSTTTATNATSSSFLSTAASLPPQMNLATVPTRTSSTNALANGIDPKKLRESPKKSPRKHKSLVSVPEEQRRRLPEVNEREWMAQSRNSKMAASSSTAQEPALSQRSNEAASHHIGSDLVNGIAGVWSAEKENILKGPYDYLESHPGKDIRTQMIAAFNAWLQVPTASLDTITRVVAMLHTASLLVDDVEDSSQLRRGIPVAHSIFGTAQTINSANYIYFCALQELLTLNNPAAVRIYTDELLNLHRGQGMDLFWRDTLTCPTEDDYLEMVGNKTGGLFRLAVKLMCAESPSYNAAQPHSQAAASASTSTSAAASATSPHPAAPPAPDYLPLVNATGLLFQVLDDYRNLSDTSYAHHKGLCEDLTEGKFSFPVIHAIRADPASLVLLNILKQRTRDDEVKRFALAHMERAGSFAYTRRVLRGLTKRALALVDEVDAGRGRGDGVRAILDLLRVDKRERVRDSM